MVAWPPRQILAMHDQNGRKRMSEQMKAGTAIRATLLRALASTCLLFASMVAGLHQTQAQGAEPLRLVVGAPAGSGLDQRVRDFTPYFEASLGRPIVIDNRSGESSLATAASVAKAPADGNTLLIGASVFVLPPQDGGAKVSFDPAKDLAPVSLVVLLQTVAIASVSTNANNVPELIALANKPGSDLKVLTEGAGTHSHLAAAWFAHDAKADFQYLHMDTLQAHKAIAEPGDRVMFGSLPLSLDDLAAHREKALAISGTKRHPLFPDLPTFAELGLSDFAPMAWFGIFAPPATPKPIIDALAGATRKAAQQPPFIEKMNRYGGEAASNSPQEFSSFIELERTKWQRAAEAATTSAH